MRKLEGKRLLARPGRRWGNYIQMAFIETEWDGADRIDVALDRDKWWDFVNTVMNTWVL